MPGYNDRPMIALLGGQAVVNPAGVHVAVGPLGVELELVLGDARAVVVFGCDLKRICVRAGDVVGIIDRRQRREAAVRRASGRPSPRRRTASGSGRR